MTNFRDADSDDWAIDIATKTIQKLLEIEKTSLHPKESIVTIKDKEELHEHENQIKQSAYECNSSEIGDKNSLEDNVDEEEHESEVAFEAETDSSTISPREGSLEERDYVDIDDDDFEKAADAGNNELTLTPSSGVEGKSSDQTESKSEE